MHRVIEGLVHFTYPQSMDYHKWTTEMDYLNGLPYTTYFEKKKKITKAWLFGIDGLLPTPFFLDAAGQLF